LALLTGQQGGLSGIRRMSPIQPNSYTLIFCQKSNMNALLLFSVNQTTNSRNDAQDPKIPLSPTFYVDCTASFSPNWNY
jgi:hypothetical protein